MSYDQMFFSRLRRQARFVFVAIVLFFVFVFIGFYIAEAVS